MSSSEIFFRIKTSSVGAELGISRNIDFTSYKKYHFRRIVRALKKSVNVQYIMEEVDLKVKHNLKNISYFPLAFEFFSLMMTITSH